MAQLAIRRGGSGDVDAAIAIWTRAHAVRYPGYEAPPALRAVVARRMELPGSMLLMASDEGLPVGAVLLSIARTRQGRGEPIAGLAHLSIVAVLPDRWGRGIATALMRAAIGEATAAGFTHVQLWVADANRRALALYEKLGFKYAGESKLGDLGERISRYERLLP